MKTLHIDIETYCDLDLSKVGVYRYVEHPSFEVLMIAFAFDDEEVQVWELESPYDFPFTVRWALTNPAILKKAHNANFERVCLSSFTEINLDPTQWRCTMVEAAYLGLPFALDKVSEVLGLNEQKDKGGKALINYFSKPCKPTKANGGRTRNLPTDSPEKWAAYKEYCAQDVRTERAIHAYTQRFGGLPKQEQRYWELDQKINAVGIKTDRDFITAAIEANAEFMHAVHAEMERLTGIDNPNSLTQLKAWISENYRPHVESLAKDALQDLLDSGTLPPHVARVLTLRQMASKTSVKKYDAMLERAQADDRIRGLVQFYGANRTGRFSGRGVQVQNLKRTLKKGLETAREAVNKGVAGLLYDDVSDVISKLTRTALIADEGRELVVTDFAAIEARVLAWIAGETWTLEVFRSHGMIYEATAANMYNTPLDAVCKELRAKGKVATLALGYQGSVGALIAMGALRDGLREDELPAIVSKWRAANPKIVSLWRKCENAAKTAIERKTTITLTLPHCTLRFAYGKGYLFITLPSGRRLSYYGAAVERGKITFFGIDQKTKQWRKLDTYGGSLVENITQAVARDCLCEALDKMDAAGIVVPMHVHDEIVAECAEAVSPETLRVMKEIMSVSPEWAKDLPLSGDGYVSKFYKKD